MSYPDAWTPMTEIEDCSLLLRYFDDPTQWGLGVGWDEAQEAAVAGHLSTSVCRTWVTVYNFPPLFEPSGTCVSAAQVYNKSTNPHGVRCTLWDYARSIVGLRPSDGFANRPLDNVGVMYGLQALQRGLITPAQFVDLNAKIGSHDIDYDWQPSRNEADLPALDAVYRSGLDNQGNHMDSVPVLDMRGPSPEIHHQYRSWSMRARLDRSNGNHGNHVIWYGPVAVIGDNTFGGAWFGVMDRWLAAIEADTSDRPIEQKVVANKPADARDRCTDGVTGNEAPACVIPFDESPRMAAGEPLTDDIFKCTLKPLNQGDYFGLVPFTADQWAQLQSSFAKGVCDFSKPGVAQKPTVAWQTYKDGPGGTAARPAAGVEGAVANGGNGAGR